MDIVAFKRAFEEQKQEEHNDNAVNRTFDNRSKHSARKMPVIYRRRTSDNNSGNNGNGSTTSQTYQDDPTSGNHLPIHTLGGVRLPGPGQQADRLPVQSPGTGFRRGTNDFAASGRQPPNAGSPAAGAGQGQGQVKPPMPVQAEPPPKERVSKSRPTHCSKFDDSLESVLT